MDFGEALKELRAGHRVQRAGWNGEGMSVAMMVEDEGMMLPYLYLRLPNTMHVPWTVSQTDVLADDWDVLE